MYSVTRLNNQSLRGALGVLMVLSLSFLLTHEVEGRNKSFSFDPAIRNDPATSYDPATGVNRERKYKTKGRNSVRGDALAPHRSKKISRPIATLIFMNTLSEGIVTGDIEQHPGQQNYFGDEEFSMGETRDMYIITCWKELKLRGDHLQTVHLYSPDGHLFQRQVVPFTTATQVDSRRRKMRRIGNAVDVRQARMRKGQQEVTVHFPIAGTWVSQHQMLGTWRVEVYYNKAKTPSGRGSFTMTE